MSEDPTRTTVTIFPQSDGGATLDLRHPGGSPIAVTLNDEIIDYLMINLPRYYTAARKPEGPTGPH